MHLKRLELHGFKSFAQKSEFVFDVPIVAIVGPNGSGKSNVVEAIRFVLGEQSVKSMRGKTGSDLIFKGSRDIPKMSRASVTIVFDNTDRVFHIHEANNQHISVDFDEIVLTREVYADGANSYFINGNEVRMKDVHELIASVNIGSSGHHIISQGEADRYLNAGMKDRRILIEEALGLKVYQYRIKESERKLGKALDNMRESELLRRELAPHLRFLKRQVEQIEKAQSLRTELLEKYRIYLAREDTLINHLHTRLEQDQQGIEKEYEEVNAFLDSYKLTPGKQSQEEQDIITIQEELRLLDEEIGKLRHEHGRLEGMIDLLKRQQSQTDQSHTAKKILPFDEVASLVQDVVRNIKTLNLNDQEGLRSSLDTIVARLESLVEQPKNLSEQTPFSDNEIVKLSEQQDELADHLHELEQKRDVHHQHMNELESRVEQQKVEEREKERSYYEYQAKKKELDGRSALLVSREETLTQRIQKQREEITEAKVLLGVSEITYAPYSESSVSEQEQEELRRDIERIKIRIEDIGGGSGGEVIKEYEETEERDAFLAKEIDDIQSSIASLESMIAELKETLRAQFEEGIHKINKEFHRFFTLMFGGGKASLETLRIQPRRRSSDDDEVLEEQEESETEYGIDIRVQLPRKKVSDLNMLSGGERSLTSIALLFALSQVNPPPFLVLDETDAALDEANSKKYGDMIESLSSFSQLVIVTHNRETMSRAHTLFGVTLGRNDASTVLSLRLEDANKYAK